MAGEVSFDVVSDFDEQELRNALDQVRREVQQRYDFKGAHVELTQEKVRIVLVTDPLKGTRRELKKADVQARQPSKLSPMPEGLLAVLPEDEILDLLAYMESGGRPGSSLFKP